MNSDVNDQISNWLDQSDNYDLGVALFSRISENRNRSLLNTLLRSTSPYNEEKVKYELDKYLKSINYVKKIKRSEKQQCKPVQKQENDSGTISKSFNESSQKDVCMGDGVVSIPGGGPDHQNLSSGVLLKIEEIKLNRNDLYSQRDYLHPQLHIVDSNEERYGLAVRILDLGYKLDVFNDQIKNLQNNNEVPVELQDRNEWFVLQRRIMSVKSYINRYKSKIRSAKTLKSKGKFNNYLEKYEKELIELENQAKN